MLHTHAPFVSLSFTATHGVTQDIQDVIGAWRTRMAGMGYREGYYLEQTKDWLNKVVLGGGDSPST